MVKSRPNPRPKSAVDKTKGSASIASSSKSEEKGDAKQIGNKDNTLLGCPPLSFDWNTGPEDEEPDSAEKDESPTTGVQQSRAGHAERALQANKRGMGDSDNDQNPPPPKQFKTVVASPEAILQEIDLIAQCLDNIQSQVDENKREVDAELRDTRQCLDILRKLTRGL
ncbi:hypothetical protein K474DRAFT_1712298 [Panus rudis PR-1116 ss-1]|nr:hypothetical protein K474DRAFT_1712298 [Panus rudis PR-1116 ss-1]